MPDLTERLLMFASLFAGMLQDGELSEKTEMLHYSLSHFGNDEDNIEAVYEKLQVLLGELFTRLPVRKLDEEVSGLPEHTPELKLLKQRFILLFLLGEMDQTLTNLTDRLNLLLLENNKGETGQTDIALNILEDEILEIYFPERYKPLR